MVSRGKPCNWLEQRIADDPALEASIRVKPPEDARLTFNQVVNDRLQERIDSNFKSYKQVAGTRRVFQWK
jgi:hypothetical protein